MGSTAAGDGSSTKANRHGPYGMKWHDEHLSGTQCLANTTHGHGDKESIPVVWLAAEGPYA